jgi:hypothetical protein
MKKTRYRWYHLLIGLSLTVVYNVWKRTYKKGVRSPFMLPVIAVHRNPAGLIVLVVDKTGEHYEFQLKPTNYQIDEGDYVFFGVNQVYWVKNSDEPVPTIALDIVGEIRAVQIS